MKVSIVDNISRDIKSFYPTSVKLAKAGRDGYKIGKRKTSVYKQNSIDSLVNISKGIYKKVSQETTVENLPVIAGAFGLLVPIYLANPIFYALGYITREIILKYRDSKGLLKSNK